VVRGKIFVVSLVFCRRSIVREVYLAVLPAQADQGLEPAGYTLV
jgi:hypothetical protein